jgi:hypothetical protein
MASLDLMNIIATNGNRNGADAMKFGLSNFPSVATNEVIEQEVLDLGDAEQLTAPLTESDQDLASLIRHVGMTSISDIDQLIGELEEARDYLKSEEERIRAETARYTALTQAASASVKIIFDAVRDWRKAGKSDRMQLSASRFEVTDAAKLDER